MLKDGNPIALFYICKLIFNQYKTTFEMIRFSLDFFRNRRTPMKASPLLLFGVANRRDSWFIFPIIQSHQLVEFNPQKSTRSSQRGYRYAIEIIYEKIFTRNRRHPV